MSWQSSLIPLSYLCVFLLAVSICSPAKLLALIIKEVVIPISRRRAKHLGLVEQTLQQVIRLAHWGIHWVH